MGKLMHKVKIEWSANFAYAIGLIATDGWLNKDGRHIGFVSKDRELVDNLKKALRVNNTVTMHARGGETEKKYFGVHIGDKTFHEFLSSIGITPAKSKTIREVKIPLKYFSDFLRGVFDGDGSFWTFQDSRWPRAFGYKLTFASASWPFLKWLQGKLSILWRVRGFIKKGDGVYEIRYTKRDTQILFLVMYNHREVLFLSRKYNKIKNAFLFDQELHPDRQKVVMPR